MTELSRPGSRSIDVRCVVDIAQTVETLHAHVTLDGIDVGPGDQVLVHNPPTFVAFGEQIVCDRQATVTRATWFGKAWTRLTSRFELGMLYEVSFTPGATPRPALRRKP